MAVQECAAGTGLEVALKGHSAIPFRKREVRYQNAMGQISLCVRNLHDCDPESAFEDRLSFQRSAVANLLVSEGRKHTSFGWM
jgi:hypothetical protein